MNVLKKCCYRSLKENRKRTLVTIIGILLATALITAVACMVVSFRASMIAYEKEANGDFHYLFSGVSEENLKYFKNNKNLVRVGILEEVGYVFLEESQNPDKPYMYISAIDEAGIQATSLHLVEGRMPENDKELVIGRHIQTNGLVEYEIGDVITVQIGSRVMDGEKLNQNYSYAYEKETLVPAMEKTYTIVGIVERPSEKVEDRMAPGYSAFTCMGEEVSGGTYEVYATYTDWGLRHMIQVTAGILGVPEELYERYYKYQGLIDYTEEELQQLQAVAKSVTENYWLLKWEILIFSSDIMSTIYTMSALALLVIILTSVFCIRNSFTISLTEKMKLYGRLSSVGTTASQQRKLVYYEAFFLGGIGILLGVICGVGATAILVKAVVGLVEDAVDITLVFAVSVPAILFGAVLSAITVFFSAAKSARKAARISPISAIRANDTVKMNGRSLHCPKWVEQIFGLGGKVAYKNLKRARVKYRTTVVSIVVSVAAFIGLSTFTQLLFFASTFYYENQEYQLVASLWDNKDCYEEALKVAELEGVTEAEVCRFRNIAVEVQQIPFTAEYLEKYREEYGDEGDIGEEYTISLRTLGEEGFARYCQKLGVSVEEARDKGILIANFEMVKTENGKIYSNKGIMAEYKPGDVITGKFRDSVVEGVGTEIEIEVLLQTKERPMSMTGGSYNNIILIVSDDWMERWKLDGDGYTTIVYMKCEDAGKVEQTIRNEIQLRHYTITNYETQYQADRSTYLVVSIFLFGFIAVVVLIGITNIFNTITTNMELRAPEFAMLKSVGMTGKEFRRMIWLEGVFYGGKALLLGIPIGVIISYCFYKALGEGIVTTFQFPGMGVGISIAAVMLLLYMIMHYSMAKINRRNILDTIRNENI